MALELRRKSKIYLKSERVAIEDNSPLSEEFFGLNDFPRYFGEGKNSFRIRPRPDSLKPNTRIDVEVIDANGNPVYWEIPSYKDDDQSRLVSVFVYDIEDRKYNTPDGPCEVIIVGTLPDDQKVRWTRVVDVVKNKKSISEVVFKDTPKGSVSSSIEVFSDISQTDGKLTRTTQDGLFRYQKSLYGDDVSFEASSSIINTEMISGSVELDLSSSVLFPRLTGQSQPTNVTASIIEVVSDTIFRVSLPITASDNRSEGSIHTYEYSDGYISGSVKYFSTGSSIVTQNQVAIANITLVNVNPVSGRVSSVNTLIKSQGLPSADFELIANTSVPNDRDIEYKVAIPTEQLNDPKTLKIQFLNKSGDVSNTEVIIPDVVFRGGNVYIGGNQSLVTGSLFIANAIGSGLEIGGHSSGFMKSVGYEGQISASEGKGPGGFIIYSGSNALQMGADVLTGVGMQFVGDNDDRHLIFSTADGGVLDVKTDKFFIGTTDSQFISGSDSNIEISSSLFHLDPKNELLIIGADAVIEGGLSADRIFTPATIGGSPANVTNASSSITQDGFARFVSASIGGWDITTASIEGGNLIMQPDGIIKTRDYQSDVRGWIISSENNGFAEFENIKVRGTLATTTFEKESVNAVGGQLWIANSTTITGSDITAADTTMSVANASGFAQDEILLIKKVSNSGFTTEYILVESSSLDGDGSDPNSVSGKIFVQRGYTGGETPSNTFVGDTGSSATDYQEGQVIVSTGKVNTGYIRMNANPNNESTPYIDIIERTGSGTYDVELKARLGDLSGLSGTDLVHGRTNPGFGLATDNVYLQGGIIATFGEIGGFSIDSTTISSSNNNLILRDSGELTGSAILLGNKSTNNYVQFVDGTMTVRGDLSVDQITTPATIGGLPSNVSNASASITSDGFAKFVSASIAGFTVNTDEIKSSDESLQLKSDGQLTGSAILLGNKSTDNFVQFDGTSMIIRGDLSVDQITTPGTIDGAPSTVANASASITSDGFAKFVSASIGGWDIYTGSIEGSNITMLPSGILQTKDFASGLKGWKISSQGNGTAEFENVRIRGTLRTTTFEKESVNAVGGQLWVVNSTTITGSVLSTETTMSVKNASGFSTGEILLLKKVDNSGFSTEYIRIESASVDGDGSTEDSTNGRIYIERAYGSGSQGDFVGDIGSSAQDYEDGQVIVSTGKVNTGYIKMNANPNDTDTPFIDIVERTGSGLYDVELKARLGDLSGLANSDYVFNRSNPGFGLATDNVFLQGGIIATFGEIGGFSIDTNTISSSNNDLILRDNGELTGSAILLGDKAGGNFVQFDGTNMVVRGDLSVDQIFTPATIDGAASNINNASSSITSDGFARFNSASIGGWDITTGSIEGSNLIMLPEGTLQTKDYATNVKGWKITSLGNGSAEFENVKIRGTLATTTFEKESVNAVGGQLYVANSTTLSGSISSSIQSSTTAVTNSFALNQTLSGFEQRVLLDEYTSVSPSNQPTMSLGTNVTVEFVGTHPVDPSTPLFTNSSNFASAQLTSISSNVFRFDLSGGVTVDELGGAEIRNTDSPGDNFIVHYSSASLSSSNTIFTNISPSASRFILDNVTGFANGEILTMKKVTNTGFSTEYVKVDSTERANAGSDSDLSGYLTVTRSYGSGTTGDSGSLGDLASSAQSYEEGQVIVSTGKVGTGYIRLNANPNDPSTPYMDIVERTGSGLYDIELKARLGDLSGLADTDLVHGRSNPGFGLATDNVYLQGGIIATFGEIGGFSIDTNTISSSNNNLILRDNGQITGSNVLLDGGVIGGFEMGANIISSSNSQLVLKSDGNITASAALISGSGIEIDTPNFLVSSSGDVEATSMTLRDASLADAFSFRFVTINSSNVSSYMGTYSGSDGKVYSVLDLSGQNSVIDNTTQGASYVRLNIDPAYPIGAIIHPYLKADNGGTNSTIASFLVIEAATNAKIAIDAIGKSSGGGARRIYSYDGTTELLDQSSKSTSVIERGYIDENGDSVFYQNSIGSTTKGGFTYNNVIDTNVGQQFMLGRNFFAWKILGASEYDSFKAGNFDVSTTAQVTSSHHGPISTNSSDLGTEFKQWRSLYGGAPQYLQFGKAGSITGTTLVQATTVNGGDNGRGYRMPTAGVVTHISAQVEVTTAASRNFIAQVYKNGVAQANKQTSFSINSTGDAGGSQAFVTGTIASPISYNAGDQITVYIKHSGTGATTTDAAIIVRVQEIL